MGRENLQLIKRPKHQVKWGRTDQPMKYIVHFAKVVELYQQKNRSFECRSHGYIVQDCLKDISKKV